jgi:RND family efflux transporter MFP subunit
VREFDRHAHFTVAVQDALQEAVIRGCLTAWPPLHEGQRHAALAHQKLLAVTGAGGVVSVPLYDNQQRIVGVIQLVDAPTDVVPAFAEPYAPALAAALLRFERERAAACMRRAQRMAGWFTSRRGQLLGLLAVAALAALAVPSPYHIDCDCQIQPVTRRFVVAPYDGTLEKCLVSPGDVVQAGEILARMDEREIRWELAGLRADQARAEKERDAAMASHRTSSAQLADLEMRRVELQIELLEHRLENLAIRSPIAGMVVAGDLQKAEGAPLTIGQSLFEVAPLERMMIEVLIPEQEIAHTQVGMAVNVTLDAFSGDVIEGTLERIHPQAELRDSQSVFVAETELENAHQRLRPGMNGSAQVIGHRHPLGWILFHKPWSRLRRALVW